MAEIIQAIIKGFIMGLLLVISVGPVIFTIIKQSINNGKEGGFSFVAGVWISDIIWVLLSNTFSVFVTGMLDFKKPIGIGGGALLITMGIFYLFFKKVKVHPEDISLPPLQGSDHAKLALQGFLLNTFNPGVMGFWLTSATALAITHTIRERVIIFSTCIAINISADIGKVILAGKLRSKLTVHNIKVINRVSGLIFLVFGSVLLFGVLFLLKKH
jgi:threonine/homoserine/homoserine lactone efflux protein